MSAVKLEDARRVISAEEEKAREIGQPMNIAVADEGGNIVAHVRMDNTCCASGPDRCTREKIPTLFRSRRSRRRSKRTRSLAEQLLLQHWKEKTMHQNSQLTASGGALLVVAVPCCDSLRIEEEQ